MLYITTRNSRDAFPAQRALRESRGPDGGMYLPFHAPSYSPADLDALAALPFGQRIAEVLNRLFQSKCSGWDVDFSVGRNPVRLTPLGHRIQAAEVWHNPGWSYAHLERELSKILNRGDNPTGGWVHIAVRIAVLFGIFGELRNSGIEAADIAVVSGDFSAPISAYYARQWGLPIETIVCCCNENSELWSLLSHGQLRTDTVSVPTVVPEADAALPEQLERLIYEAGGTAETARYLEACRRGGMYLPGDGVLVKLRRGLQVSVVSSRRVLETIPSIYRTRNYVLSPGSALAYAGLMDYRAKTGQTRNALILAEKSPLCAAKVTACALGVTEEELRDLI